MRKLTTLSLLSLFISVCTFGQGLMVENLRCEFKRDPVGVDIKTPRLSWEIGSEQRNVLQTAYQVLVADNPKALSANLGNVWDSKKLVSAASIQVKYEGKALLPAKSYFWKVRVWDNKRRVSAWSNVASWQTGLFAAGDWKDAKWIAYEKLPDSEKIVPAIHGKGGKNLGPSNNVLPLFRKDFAVKAGVKRATVFISGLGHFEMSLNGRKTGDHFLDPGWTKYDKEALYVTFDVTGQLKEGKNVIGVMLGNGFYYTPRDKRYRKLTSAFGYPKMICRVLLEYQNGTTENILSDATWETSPGPVTYSSIYGGEDYDAGKEQTGWNTAAFNGKGWKPVILTEGPPVLKSQTADPLKTFESFVPVDTMKISGASYVFDLGQNASGIPEITVQGKKGDTVRITPAELLNDDNTANQKATGKPVYYDYILKGEGVETWSPRFTYYGYRYLQIDGAVPQWMENAADKPVLKTVRGMHIRNAAEKAGEFTSSNDLFNRTRKLIDWAIRSNMVSVFTDCPHRERLGWQEQVHLVGNSIRYNYNIANLCRKVLSDLRTAQTPEGLIPGTVPEYTVMDFAGGVFRDSPEWGSNAIILPWYLYEWYGDREALESSYQMMQRYLEYLSSKASGYIISYGLSDWYDIGPQRSGFSQMTPMGLTATAYYYYDLIILQKAALLLGKKADAAKYAALASEVKLAFNKKFYDKEKKQYGSGSQTSNAMAVYMNLVDPEDKDAVVDNIVKDIRNRNNSLTAGDIGFRYLIQVLADAGRSDVIYDMNSNTEVPGYGYQLAKGATALTESWVASPAVSNNHFMLGHILEWFYSDLAGIRPAENSVAFNRIVIHPELVGDITSGGADHYSPYGLISSRWTKTANEFELTIKIPVNTKAEVWLPAEQASMIMEGGRPLTTSSEILLKAVVKGKTVLEVGSGVYRFTVKIS
ncbi:family 78 glycoside hydrolase catalytic domain [Arcticibacter tournemirensis]|uniref:alpha-L-rhamnosidase n=1 Tax=Arcticibacter tournemirensis TaxID=699437 RepID=A0A4Q0MCI8_9SPHI|nr:family 78 glycoside hydrolase catalytic domain [Arcticibacter tournemirensis]RXF71040.1 alpha-L-rhamnosidase [Arcticibacter tournemirensis]